MNHKTIHIAIDLRSNGQTKLVNLEGCTFIESGFLVGTIIDQSGELSVAEQVLLTAFTFTGCPIAAREDVSGANPWRKTGGEYRGHRVLCAPGFNARSEIQSRPSPGRIAMRLSVEYTGSLPDLRGVAHPFQEHIRQTAPGEFRGEFAIPFSLGDESVLSGEAKTEYHLPDDVESGDAWRNITILAKPTIGTCLQIEQIDLFASADRANRDLQEKTDVTNTILETSARGVEGSLRGATSIPAFAKLH